MSFGYFATTLLLLPLGLLRLEDNTFTQILSFFILMLCCSEFLIAFVLRGFTFDLLPSSTVEASKAIGPVLFNFAFAVTIPAWLNEKASKVSVNRTVWFSSSVSALLFLGTSLLGALSYREVPDDLLQVKERKMGKWGKREERV